MRKLNIFTALFITAVSAVSLSFSTAKAEGLLISEKYIWPEISGITNGYRNLQRDNFLNISMVFPAPTVSSLSDFRISHIVSRESDTLKIKGKSMTFPSNISIPKQTEKYFFFSILMNKPKYRMYVSEPRDCRMMAWHIRFPFTKVVREIRSGRSLISLLNDADGLSVGVLDSFYTKEDKTANKDIHVESQIILGQKKQILKTSISSGSILVLSLFEDGKHFFVQDMKYVYPNQSVALKVTPNKKNYTFSILTEGNSGKKRTGTEIASQFQDKPFSYVYKRINYDYLRPLRVDPSYPWYDDDPFSAYSSKNSSSEAEYYYYSKMSAQLHKSKSEAYFLPYVKKPELSRAKGSSIIVLASPSLVKNIQPRGMKIDLSEVSELSADVKFRYLVKKSLLVKTYIEWKTSVDLTEALELIEDGRATGKHYRVEVTYYGHDKSTEKEFTHMTRNFLDL